MPNPAIGDGQSVIENSDCGSQGSQCATSPDMWHWDSAYTSASDECSSTVFFEGYGAVLEGHKMEQHPWYDPCTPAPIPHAPVLDTFLGNPTVFVDGLPIGRVGDMFNSEGGTHTISTGAASIEVG